MGCLIFVAVEAQKGKGKGKGKGAAGKGGKGKGGSTGGKGKGKGNGGSEEGGNGEEGGKGKGKGKGSGEEGGNGEGEIEPPPVPEPRPGFCVSHEDMMVICAAGSAMEEKSPAAMEACAEFLPNPEEGGKGKGKGKGAGGEEGNGGKGKGKGSTGGKGKGKGSTGGKGKGGKGKGSNSNCPSEMPSAEDILAQAQDTFAAEICMFTSMGWVDSDMVADQGQITADIMTLPSEISDALTGDDYTACLDKFEDEAMGFGGCMDGFTDDEKLQIGAAMNGVAHIMCFKSVFEESCGLYMSNTMASMAGLGNTGSGSA